MTDSLATTPQPGRKPVTKMPVIGLVGGVASGKSLVADCFQQLGAERIDGDQLGHHVLQQPELIALLQARWGPQVLTASGQIDRRAVAQRVFAVPSGSESDKEWESDKERESHQEQDLAWLESQTHPAIARMLVQRIEALRGVGQAPAIVVDAAVMLKAGWDRHCDHVVFVECPDSVRLARALQRGWSEEQFRAREQAQLPLVEKRRRCNSVLSNAGHPDETCQLVRKWWNQWLPRLQTAAAVADPGGQPTVP